MTLPVGIAVASTQSRIRGRDEPPDGCDSQILVFALAVQRYLVLGLSLGAVKDT